MNNTNKTRGAVFIVESHAEEMLVAQQTKTSVARAGNTKLSDSNRLHGSTDGTLSRQAAASLQPLSEPVSDRRLRPDMLGGVDHGNSVCYSKPDA